MKNEQQLVLELHQKRMREVANKINSERKSSGPGCSKLTMSIVNIPLKFQTLKTTICQYVLSKNILQKRLSFFNKNISLFHYKVIKHLTS